MKHRKVLEGAARHVFEETPIGWILAVFGGTGLRSLLIDSDKESLARRLQEDLPQSRPAPEGEAGPFLDQLREYFAGNRRQFDIPVDLRGLSPFSLTVLEALQQVSFGETTTYGQLAARIGRPRAARAVGRVMAGNRLPLVFPCHRVVGTGGALTGYSGGRGLGTKQWLLDFERRLLEKQEMTTLKGKEKKLPCC